MQVHYPVVECLSQDRGIAGLILTGGYCILSLSKVKKKAKVRNRYNQVPHMTQDTVWEGEINTRKHHIQGSQEVSPCPIGDHKTARKRHDRQDTLNPA